MKLILLTGVTLILHLPTNAQTTPIETIECQGETIVLVNGDDVQTTRNPQNAAIYTFNMEDSILTIKSVSRTEGVSQDQFLITRKVSIGGKDVYDLANPSSLDQSTYGVSVEDSNVKLMIFVNGRTITVTSPIAKRYNQQIIIEKSKRTSALFLGGDSFDTTVEWDKGVSSEITIHSGPGSIHLPVKYIEETVDGITISVNRSFSDTITINFSGQSSFGTFSNENDYTIQEVIEELVALLPSKKDYDTKISKPIVKKGQRLQAYSFTTDALKTTSIGTTPTPKAKSASRIRSIFTIGENRIATNENKEIYVQLITPDNAIYQTSENNVFTTSEGKTIAFSGMRTIAYENNSLEIAVFIDLEKGALTSGTHKIFVYCDGYLIGTDSLTLR